MPPGSRQVGVDDDVVDVAVLGVVEHAAARDEPQLRLVGVAVGRVLRELVLDEDLGADVRDPDLGRPQLVVGLGDLDRRGGRRVLERIRDAR